MKSSNVIWEDFKEMIEDIKSYLVADKQLNIVCDDNPYKLLLGFRCEQTNKDWYISLSNLKKCLGKDQGNGLIKSLSSIEGRNHLLTALNSRSFCI